MTLYLSGASAYGIFLIYRMFCDPECSKTDTVSWMVIAVASLFWMIVIPLSLLELQSKYQSKKQIAEIAAFGDLLN